MIRTQIYLSAPERKSLHAIARATGKSQSHLIREAVDRLIHSYAVVESERRDQIDAAFGIWQDRSADEFQQIRRSLDRGR